MWNEWLVRAPGAEAPELRTLDDLTPWSCTVDEAARAFAPARPSRARRPPAGVSPSPPRTRGVRREAVAEFTWGLVQRVAVTGAQV